MYMERFGKAIRRMYKLSQRTELDVELLTINKYSPGYQRNMHTDLYDFQMGRAFISCVCLLSPTHPQPAFMGGGTVFENRSTRSHASTSTCRQVWPAIPVFELVNMLSMQYIWRMPILI